MNLSGKVAVVTGASSGIGAAIARELSASGMNLVLTARNGNKLNEVCKTLAGEAKIVPARIDAPETAQLLLDQACEHFGCIDVLVNNAGVLSIGSVDDADLDELSAMIRTNFESVVRNCYLFARAFKARRHGAIVNVSSVAAFYAKPAVGVYAGLKAAIETFSNSLRIELGPYGVKVGCIAPGSTNTDMLSELRAGIGAPNNDPAVAPEDIAAAIRFMLEQPREVNIAGIRVYSALEKT